MPEDEWVEKIKKLKDETEKSAKQIQTAEKEFRQEHEDERKKLVDMIYSESKPIEDVYFDPSKGQFDQPKLNRSENFVNLEVPIAESGTSYGFGISFSLRLTDEGYGVDVKWSNYDATRDQNFQTSNYIPPPVSTSSIREVIEKFLQARKDAIISMAERNKRLGRYHG